MSRTNSSKVSEITDYAVWLDWAKASRAEYLDPAHPAFRVFREAGVDQLGMDMLKDRFFAGTPCSPTHLVWIVTRGSVSMDFGAGPVILQKGQLALCPAFRPHWVRLVSKSARGIWFHLKRVSRWQHLSNVGPGIHPAKHAAEMEWLLEHCLAECASIEFGANTNALHYAEILEVMLERVTASFGPRPKEQPGIRHLEKLWDEIMKNPGKPWNVAVMAQAAGISSREMHRLCAKLHGIGPMGLVTRMRMDRAMELLHASSRKIEDIASEVGYGTAHAFSEVFLSHVGTRPGRFRNSRLPESSHPFS